MDVKVLEKGLLSCMEITERWICEGVRGWTISRSKSGKNGLVKG